MTMRTDYLTEQEADVLRESVAEAVLAARTQDRADLDSDPDAHLIMVAASRVAAEETGRLLRQSINGARAAGHSWEVIGRLLGVSRQAAQQRFATKPGDPTPTGAETDTRKVLQPLHAFNEMDALATEGRRGWHVVDYGFLYHLVEASPHQWEHQRQWWPSRRRRRRMEEEGWQVISPTGFDSPWVYYKRPLDKPAEPAYERGSRGFG